MKRYCIKIFRLGGSIKELWVPIEGIDEEAEINSHLEQIGFEKNPKGKYKAEYFQVTERSFSTKPLSKKTIRYNGLRRQEWLPTIVTLSSTVGVHIDTTIIPHQIDVSEFLSEGQLDNYLQEQ